jgi:hypothetical protein
MRRFRLLVATTLILASSIPVVAQEKCLGNLQRYGGPWRYQHRDWSNVYGRLDPGVCWKWDDNFGRWVWICSG